MSKPVPRRLLAIDTSSRRGSVAIDWDGELLHAELKDSRAHASDLLPELDALLSQVQVERIAGVLPFDTVIVGTGPGSYTGLRIGIASARALAWASGAELIGVSSFEALAFGALEAGQCAAIAQDARAGKFYYARYERLADSLRTLQEPQLLGADRLAEALLDEALILGEENIVRAAGLEEDCAERIQLGAWPSAKSLLILGRSRTGQADLPPVEPLYLRAFGE